MPGWASLRTAGRDNEIDRFRIVGQRDVFGRRLVRVQPIRMRVIDAEEFKPSLAEFHHQAHNLLGRNLVIPDRISRDVVRRERLRDESVLPRQNSAALPMRLPAGMLQELPVHSAAASHGALHSESIYRSGSVNRVTEAERLLDVSPYKPTCRTSAVYLGLLSFPSFGLFLGLPKGFEIRPDVLYAFLVQDLDDRLFAL